MCFWLVVACSLVRDLDHHGMVPADFAILLMSATASGWGLKAPGLYKPQAANPCRKSMIDSLADLSDS